MATVPDLLAVAESADEAKVLIGCGVDRLVVRRKSAEADACSAAVAMVARGRCPVALWWGSSDAPTPGIVTTTGADEVWIRDTGDAPLGPNHWAVLAPDAAGALPAIAARGYAGIVVDAGDEPEHLLARVAIQHLEALARQARSLGLGFGLSGTLEPPDVPRLLAIAPDRLVFDGLLRRDGRPGGAVVPDRVRLVHELVHGGGASALAGTTIVPVDADRIFIRDWTVPLHVGAYGHEHAPQRVRFTIEAEVERSATRAADMRDVVTYDLIIDAIARATIAHVALVETIAEDVAALILAHPRVSGVDVTVEKLDLGPGSLGCRIKRRRAT